MLVPGDILEQKYRIVRKIGEGGMGAVFEAEAIRIHRRVAIKVMRIHSNNSDELAQRFQLEAQAAGRIGSRHIVEVLDLGLVDSIGHFMVMEYLEGESLRARIARAAPLSPDAIYTIAEQLLEGVVAAHGAGIVHRDLKPDNIFLVRQGNGTDFVKLLDFGISKFSLASGAEGGIGLTRTGALLGTPCYLSPEQASGSKVIDHRADIYALGVILYECLTAEVPFEADTFNELLFKIVLEPAKPIPRAILEAAPSFCALVERAMLKDPKQRFSTALEMKSALDGWMRGADPAAAVPRNSEVELETARPSATTDAPNTIETWASSGDYARPEAEASTSPRRYRRVGLGLAALALSLLAAAGLLLFRAASPDTVDAALSAASAFSVSPSVPHAPSRLPPAGDSLVPAPLAGSASVLPASPNPENPARSPLPRAESPQPAQRAARPGSVAPPASAARTPVPVPESVPARGAPARESEVLRTPGGRVFRGDL